MRQTCSLTSLSSLYLNGPVLADFVDGEVVTEYRAAD